MKELIKFLKLNGFRKQYEGLGIEYTNDKCIVRITLPTDDLTGSGYYEVESDEGSSYSKGLEIYWLIGLLTYYDLMDKNYKQ